jgi:hypothetical protein
MHTRCLDRWIQACGIIGLENHRKPNIRLNWSRFPSLHWDKFKMVSKLLSLLRTVFPFQLLTQAACLSMPALNINSLKTNQQYFYSLCIIFFSISCWYFVLNFVFYYLIFAKSRKEWSHVFFPIFGNCRSGDTLERFCKIWKWTQAESETCVSCVCYEVSLVLCTFVYLSMRKTWDTE